MLEGVVVDNRQLLNTKLQEWEHFYDFDRPHTALDGQTAYERCVRKLGPHVSGRCQLNKSRAGGI